MADTDSAEFIIDLGANRIIVNDAKLLTNMCIIYDKIKDVEGHCIRIKCAGYLTLALKSDKGNVDIIRNLDAVYVPRSPYNLLPPQLIISQMKRK